LVAAQFEFVYEFNRKQAFAAGNDLSKFDVGRTKFFLINHGSNALLSTHTTTIKRAPGGMRVGVVKTGTSRCAETRNSMACFSHEMLFGSSTHGATLSKAPQAQSAGLELTGDVTHQVCPHEGHQ
jgi:hypothetical protein